MISILWGRLLMNSEEELLPKWYPSVERKGRITENIFAGFLLVLITIFTLGIFTGLQHTNAAMKGKN